MFHGFAYLLGAGLPNFSPTFDFPGGKLLLLGLDIVLGIIVIWMMIIFFHSFGGWANDLRSGRHGGGSSLVAAGGAFLVILLILTGAGFLNDWLKYLSPYL